MGGAAKIFNTKNLIRGATAGLTGGLSEFTRKDPFGGMDNPLGLKSLAFGGSPEPPPLASMPGGQSPTELLAQTGGAPVLAQIAMGVSPKAALAGYMGIPEAQFDEYVKGLNPKDAYALTAVQNQLTTIASTSELRNKAVQQVVQDFPNVTAKIAQDRQAAGGEFDEATKSAMDYALKSTASKYAAGGNLSSGAANEAFARVGAERAQNKLDYMSDREKVSASLNLADYSNRLAEVNGLRDFQNTMLTGKASEGFSANQANLGRIQQSGQFNAAAQNDAATNRYNQDNATRNAMFGALGSLGGSFIGGRILASSLNPSTNPVGGSTLTPMGTPKVRTPGYDYGRA